MSEIVVKTTAGSVKGTAGDGVVVFKGVPYGASTAGSARFLPPQPAEAWDGVLEPTESPIACPQPSLEMLRDVTPPELVELGAALEGFTEHLDEDCLRVNVWTPSLEGARPVMVWFHGGGFTIGSGNLPSYDGTHLAARNDVVVVNVNHRLGALGYFDLSDLGGEAYASSGMAGILDLVLALEWVRDNIASFGGDPDNVTIFGESGGGAKVSLLLGMPSAEGLFHRAIIQSGPCLRAMEKDKARQTRDAIMVRLGVTTLDELLAVPADALVDAQVAVLGGVLGGFGGGHNVGPVLDGIALPNHPFDPVAAPTAGSVPLLIGSTRDEMTIFTAMLPGFDSMVMEALPLMATMMLQVDGTSMVEVYRRGRPEATAPQLMLAMGTDLFRVGSIHLAERSLEAGAAPVYMYRFDIESPVLDGRLGATHGVDLGYVFDNIETNPINGVRPDGQQLADLVSRTWATFARTGDPNNEGLPEWPAYDTSRRATMLLDTRCQVVDDPHGEERAAWKGITGGL